jgi:hypothetical protein
MTFGIMKTFIGTGPHCGTRGSKRYLVLGLSLANIFFEARDQGPGRMGVKEGLVLGLSLANIFFEARDQGPVPRL